MQADSATAPRYGGTSLGLAISKQLIELIGAPIGVTSRPGEGSTLWFTLDLPLVAEPLAKKQTVPRACPAAQLAPATTTAQFVRTQVLEELGCRADVAANGNDAVEMVSRFPYGLAFMDCLMPGMDGFEASGAIRRLEGGKRHVPIVAMTALAMDRDSKPRLAARMDDNTARPVAAHLVQAGFDRAH